MERAGEHKVLVEVLLATFNGERYLREQIDSILAQDYPDLLVLARDDGSTDRTVEILNEYAASYSDRVRVYAGGDPTGHPKLNFLCLMKASTAEYLCFSDQDDVWLPGKVSLVKRAMQRLEDRYGETTPLLVFTDLRVVDERLETLNPSLWKRAGVRIENIHHLARVLSENVVTGCTVMINRSMRDLAVQMPDDAEMHDWWIALLSAVFGAAEATPQATVLYRQHANNVIGSIEQHLSLSSLSSRIRKRGKWRQQRLKCERQAEALLRIYGERMTLEQKNILEAFLVSGRSDHAWTRVGTMIKYGFYRSGFLKNAAAMIDLFQAKSTDNG
jgi:hypothetical protein